MNTEPYVTKADAERYLAGEGEALWAALTEDQKDALKRRAEKSKTVEVPARTETRAEYTCDLCGELIVPKRGGGEEVEVTHTTGDYGRESSLVYEQFDMCGECFQGKLIPWMASQGVKPHVRSWDS